MPSFTATEKQNVFIDAVFSNQYRFLAIGGGIRGTKTWATLATLILLCRIFPRSRWAIVRKDLPTLRRNTIPSIEKIRLTCSGFLGDLNQSVWTYKARNGSEIVLFPEGFERDPELNRWRGLEVNGFLLEEANELVEPSFHKAIERAGAWIIPPTNDDPNPVQPPPFVFCTFNPCNNWPRVVFYDRYHADALKPPYFYLPSTIKDNPYAPPEYLESLKSLPPQVYQRYVEGRWDVMDDPEQLIPTELILAAQMVEPTAGDYRLGADVARFGDDQSVLAHRRGNALAKLEAWDKLSTTQFAEIIHNRIFTSPVPVKVVNVDAVGLGGGTVDRLYDLDVEVVEIVAGERPIKRPKNHLLYTVIDFADLKSQIYYEFMLMLKLGLVSLPPDIPPRLLADLTGIHYRITTDKKLKVDGKDDVRKRIGRSPDSGEATVLAYFDYPIRPNLKKLPPSKSYSSVRP